MAAVSEAEEPMSEELREDRTQRALQLAVISGFLDSARSVEESCLGLCNASRDGLQVECVRIAGGAPATRRAMVLPECRYLMQTYEPTRVLQPRRIQQMEWAFTEEHVEEWERAQGQMRLGPELYQTEWPEGVKEIRLILFNGLLDAAPWPKSLERLSFCSLLPTFPTTRLSLLQSRGCFNRPLEGPELPSGLRELFLGSAFNQPIDDVIWPDTLERLSLPGFNNSIDNVTWPPRLKALEFLPPSQILLREKQNVRAEELDIDTGGHDYPFSTLPATLETLWLSDAFAQRCLSTITWPSGITTLGLGVGMSDAYIVEVTWPPTLKHLYLMREVTHENRPPPDCVVSVVTDYDTESQSYDLDFDDRFIEEAFFDYDYDVCEDDEDPEFFENDFCEDGYDSPAM